jgi:hypothetical protein
MFKFFYDLADKTRRFFSRSTVEEWRKNQVNDSKLVEREIDYMASEIDSIITSLETNPYGLSALTEYAVACEKDPLEGLEERIKRHRFFHMHNMLVPNPRYKNTVSASTMEEYYSLNRKLEETLELLSVPQRDN